MVKMRVPRVAGRSRLIGLSTGALLIASMVVGAAALVAADNGPTAPESTAPTPVGGYPTPTATSVIDSTALLSIAEALKKVEAESGVLEVAQAVQRSDPEAMLMRAAVTSFPCQKGDTRFGAECSDSLGEAGAVVLIDEVSMNQGGHVPLAQARSVLHALLDGNTTRLTLVAKANGHVFLGYAFERRSDSYGGTWTGLIVDVDPTLSAPIVDIATLTGTSLRNWRYSGHRDEDILAVDADVLRFETEYERAARIGAGPAFDATATASKSRP